VIKLSKIKDEQMEAGLNDSNEMVLIESKTMRDNHVYRDDVLEKVKIVPSLPNTIEITTEMAANYYEVSPETIRTIIKRNREEFNEYEEMRVLKGRALNDFCKVHDELHKFISVKSRSVTMLNRRGLLRLGMLLTESEVAKSIRNYLLNVEEISDKQQRQWAVEREISKRERRMLTDSIQMFYEGSSMHGHEYTNFTNLVYKALFDCNATQLKKLYELDKNDPLRDSLTTEDLRRVVEVERVISSLIKVGKDYDEIKEMVLNSKDKF
jgi:hypothetical protein